ncbi:L,D-transpeptidase [Sphingomonas endophytica]|uniref:Lipoprotein-anchoring transpeptidase ErfK/SrfK n=1 Tax=Sphingomonas endophytica TaxID=869719 RepID=A0ABR6N6Z0_9SPHN|nr:lipoprotein-anchoring transpeptidase ErfK/SrfK [Sphingomonas endophytica]
MKRIAPVVSSMLALTFTAAAPAQQGATPPLDPAVLRMQVVLDKLGFGPGVIDGRGGQSLTNALKGFQESRGLRVTGKPDAATLDALRRFGNVQPTMQVTLDAAAMRGPYVPQMPDDYAEKAKLPAMAYSRPLEKLAERFHTTPKVLAELNPGVTTIGVGSKITVPNSFPTSRAYPADATPQWRATLASLNVEAAVPKAAKIVVDKSDGILRVLDGNGHLVAQYTATIGSSRDPLPLGNWKVLHVSPNPDWKMNPKILKGVPDSKQAQIIPPGPNNPVGVVWIDLSKEHYGIHGTSEPEQIGRAQSNGCVRLTNWDAARVALMVKGGTPVLFQA